MSYVSFVDIFANKAVSNFAEAGFSQATAYTLASVCFFAGFPISYVLDKIADSLVERYVAARGKDDGNTRDESGEKVHICVQHASTRSTATGGAGSTAGVEGMPTDGRSAESCRSKPQSSCKLGARAAADLDSGSLAYAATDTTLSGSTSSLNTCPDTNSSQGGVPALPHVSSAAGETALDATCTEGQAGASAVQVLPAAALVMEAKAEAEAERSRALVRMGFLAALAVALHNCPEGLVTFVGYMDSMGTGITTAVAITLHNIPEGMVIASSIYYGTKSLSTALLWASIAALTEPLGGLIGLAVVCGGSMSHLVFGILFGLVAGIMVYISLKELLPGARRFDPQDKVTTLMTILGMAVMSASLTVILYSQPGGSTSAVPGAVPAPTLPFNVCTNATGAIAAPPVP
ncbi:hypothetical protein HXX76_005253 [Chlamydomonas incerta]|uniref:Uncharacterized protein n=1 Tax=Chlamydomonas incerta TaxID=51695 RepID=A0A835T7Y5_CHLIN|nr:hypothetical protein HXX76_005253 [Chlamydomonas incerta]|eukprot:KAG2438707.1 hypothetical protein HXX76_005253 [Chlamydomonas incerta]